MTTTHLEPQASGSEPTVGDRRRAAEFWSAYLGAQLGLTDGVEALNRVLDEVNDVDRLTPFLIAVADVAVDASPELLSGSAFAKLRTLAVEAARYERANEREAETRRRVLEDARAAMRTAGHSEDDIARLEGGDAA